MRRFVFLLVPIVVVLLSGCDMLGIESPEAIAAAREAEGKAVGGACRHAGRAIEDCYALNRKAEKAAVFAGWRDMNDYMRENKIEAVMPQLVAQTAGAGSKATAEDKAEATTAEKAEKRPPKSAAVSKPKSKGPDS